MKWMLIVAVFGGQPVETGLLFENLKDCLAAEQEMRQQMVSAYEDWEKWASEGDGLSRYGGESREAGRAFQQKRILNHGTCVPHAG
jgi:hypothetical protein